ncbi:hypothetical protein [Natronoarchaeum rubrum]|uniref:hypothetical protein n=1 Tax=Natronoarchaeum rubrum TaxID=755311 RepID=UPI0021119741|nr:hypothetical protein [Natronoarchaeum rubrum]
MSRTGKFACAGCDRTFLSASARRRHYEWNPEHGKTGPHDDGESDPATDAEASAREDGPVGDRWVEFDDRFETFLTFDECREARITVEHRPDDGAVIVDQSGERRIDLSAVRGAATDRLRWSFDGTHLTLTVPKSVGVGS